MVLPKSGNVLNHNYFQDKNNTMNFCGVELTIYSKKVSELLNSIVESGFNIKRIMELISIRKYKKKYFAAYEDAMKRPSLITIEAEKV